MEEGAAEGWKISESDACADFVDKIRDDLFDAGCLEQGNITVVLTQWMRSNGSPMTLAS